MLVVENNTIHKFWGIGDTVHPLDYSGDVIVVFDPSKTNMAMIVGTPDKTILNTLEFSGNNRTKGPVMDTTQFCLEVRHFLTRYLSKCNLYLVAVEQAITKQGTSYHHSNMVLTEIRSNLLNFFLEQFGIKVIEVNNWSWKFAILPEGYRSKYEKGSKKWFVENMPESPFAHYYQADMTDCICIYWYLVSKKCANYTCYCNKYEACSSEYMYFYAPLDSSVTNDAREVTFNPRFTVVENLNYYVNRIFQPVYMQIPIETDLGEVYNHAFGFEFSNMDDKTIKVVARRK